MAQYYWCLTHQRVEEGTVCRAANRLGPYESPEAARNWSERVEQRAEKWKAEDERWHGEDEGESEDA
jgi:hypothetical protein